jgi:L-threonylcarbamoyladenylate synthase
VYTVYNSRMEIAKINKPEEAIKKAVEILNHEGLVIFPCETVYGIAADCLSQVAVEKLSKYKQRPLGKPYAIMVSDEKMANKYVELNETAKKLYAKFLPGPLTVISKSKHKTAGGVESETGTLGVRIPDYNFMRKLIEIFGRPVVATSANASYKKRPYVLDDVWDNITIKQRKLVDMAIDAGELPHNEPSTVIDTTSDDVVTLRQGEMIVGNKLKVMSRGEENTQNLGKELWQKYDKYFGQRAVVFALEGPMGVGKTQLTKGIAKAMGVTDEVISPTYNLELDYSIPGKLWPLVHVDAWRMNDSEEIQSLGLKKIINDKSVVVIEWADRVADVVRKYNEEAVVVWVRIEYGEKEDERYLSWEVK